MLSWALGCAVGHHEPPVGPLTKVPVLSLQFIWVISYKNNGELGANGIINKPIKMGHNP